MKALITGASSGLGRDMARVLSKMGYDIIAVARRESRLIDLKNELDTNVEILCLDVTDETAQKKIAEKCADCDVFINNAGFGVFGEFISSDLETELKMAQTNALAVHALTKLVAQKFCEKDKGYILNVASMAAFLPGPLFSAYYATKAYVLRISEALAFELKKKKSGVKVSVLCPGPVNTEFGDIANLSFGTGKEFGAKLAILESPYVAKYAIKKMFSGKTVIIPGLLIKTAVALRRFLPSSLLIRAVYAVQSKKIIKK